MSGCPLSVGIALAMDMRNQKEGVSNPVPSEEKGEDAISQAQADDVVCKETRKQPMITNISQKDGNQGQARKEAKGAEGKPTRLRQGGETNSHTAVHPIIGPSKHGLLETKLQEDKVKVLMEKKWHQRSEPVFDPNIEATIRRARAAKRRQNQWQQNRQEGSSEMANQGGNPENNRNPGGDQQNRPERLLRDFFIPQQEEVQSPLVFPDQPNWNNAPQQGNYQRPTQPPRFHRQDGQPPNYHNQQRSNQQYIPREDEWISVQNAIKNFAVSWKSLENQLAQIAKQNAEKPSGSMPSVTVVNPKGNDQKQAKAITLRSGKQLNQPSEKVTLVSEPAGNKETFSEKISDNGDLVEHEQATKKPGMDEIQFPAPIKKPQEPVPIPPYPERMRYLSPQCDSPSPHGEPTPPPPPQPPRALQEQALNAITDEWEPRLFPRKKAWDFLLKHLKRKIIAERGIGEDGEAFAYIKRHSTEGIRAIWKLPRVSTDYRETITALHPNQPLEQAILSRLAKEGTDWEKDDQDNPLGFYANALQTPDLNLWHHLICCNLMPTTYTSKVTYEQAMILSQGEELVLPSDDYHALRKGRGGFLNIDAKSSLQQPLRLNKLDQRPPGASSSGQATSTPTPAGQLRQRDFNKKTRFILDYVHQCQIRTEQFLQEMHKCIGYPENCPLPHDPPAHSLHGMPP
ncbi:OLC1v1005415C1 [Oldenlandia corymbosa var. corymbosa]|uniref:OLC1v1005415C1 n=1 Tax=Oldenlandia corymbosa var. corymbosa TaxID=529605 RepID=A0AAV1DEJ9_OLDCO|nr:OLC1v1005415C1 [Oldenlandia corymbosa var. corymbosa]